MSAFAYTCVARVVDRLGSNRWTTWYAFETQPRWLLDPMPQLTSAEQNMIDQLVRTEKKKPIEAWRAVEKSRVATKVKGKKVKGLNVFALWVCAARVVD